MKKKKKKRKKSSNIGDYSTRKSRATGGNSVGVVIKGRELRARESREDEIIRNQIFVATLLSLLGIFRKAFWRLANGTSKGKILLDD